MPSRESEAVVLRTYPFRDADLVVSFFTREQGKLRGVAAGVRRPKNKFGVSLERLAHSRLFYMQKENAELVSLQRAELIGPANLWKAGYAASVVLDVVAETADLVLPEREPQDSFFRLLTLVGEEFQRGIAEGDSSGTVPDWAHRALVYFLLWSARLGGWLPPLDRCIASGKPFAESERCYFSPHKEGLFRVEFRDGDSWPLPAEARSLAGWMLKNRPVLLEGSEWPAEAALALQRYLLQCTQAQIGDRLRGLQSLRDLWQEDGALTGR